MNANKLLPIAAALCSLLAACGGTDTAVSDAPGAANASEAPPTQDKPEQAVSAALSPAPSNRAPIAADHCQQVAGDPPWVDGELAALSEDPDQDALHYAIAAPAQHGSVELDPSSGAWRYYPASGERGYRDGFDFRVVDTQGAQAQARVELVVGSRRIMPLGDSITFGVTGYTGATGDLPTAEQAVGYRQRLYQRLRADGYDVDFVGSQRAGAGAGLSDPDHQGHPGWTAWQIGDALPAWLDANPPDLVLAHVGTNDHSSSAAAVDHVLNQLAGWSATNHPVAGYVARIVDQRPDTFFTDTVEAFNAALDALLGASWPAVVPVDQYAALDNETDLSPLSSDSVGLHPNADGYLKMADTWYQALVDTGALARCD